MARCVKRTTLLPVLQHLARTQASINAGPTVSLTLLDVLRDSKGQPVPVSQWSFDGKTITSVDSDDDCDILHILPYEEEDEDDKELFSGAT